MAQIVYAKPALLDLEKLTDFLLELDTSIAIKTLGLIEEAVGVLKRHPFIGRQVDTQLRELVISHGKTGYIALYSYEANQDVVLILAIRHQREAGYSGLD